MTTHPYRGRRVCVLGASGFLGSAVIAALAAQGARVVALARGIATSLTLPHGVEFVQGDVRREADVARAMAGGEVVFACAGRSGAAASFDDPAEDIAQNVLGLVNVLRVASRAERPPKIVFPSSRLVYGSQPQQPVGEEATPNPSSPYALDKWQCERYLELYRAQFGVPYAALRITNPFGPAPAPGWRGYNVLNVMLMRALAGAPVSIYGDGQQLRDYIYVDDVTAALLYFGAHEATDILVNVGSGVGRRFVDAARIVAARCGVAAEFVPWPPDAARVESGDFVADISLARRLGWQPATDFEAAVDSTIASLKRS